MSVETFSRYRRQGEQVHEFMHLVLILINRGYTVEVRPVLKASMLATVRNAMDKVVGDLNYRDAIDETMISAVGISYSCYLYDPQYHPDSVFETVVSLVNRRKHAAT